MHHVSIPIRGARALVLLLSGILISTSAVGQTVFYLNDLSTNGTVYTTAPGSDSNDGLSPGAPMLTLTNLLAAYSLGPGDVVYIDSGIYSNTAPILISSGGAVGNPVTFRGAGKSTVIRKGPTSFLFDIRVSHIHFDSLFLEGGLVGLYAGSGGHQGRVGLRVKDSYVVGSSLDAIRRANWVIEGSVFANNRFFTGDSNVEVINSVIWNNEEFGRDSPVITSRNSIWVGNDLEFPILGDFNIFDVRRIPSDYLLYLNQPNSMIGPVDFVDSDNLDFRLSANSLGIDFGDPANTAWTNEPAPNGGRINAGIFGGTTNATTSPTSPWLRVLTFDDGGAVTGSVQTLRWNGGAFAPGATVKVQYSSNAGASWTDIVTGVPATNRVANWNVAGEPPMAVFWRVVLESDPSVYSVSGQRFAVNGAKVPFFVNDGSTVGDVYTTAPGSDLNDGLTPATPMATLTNLFATYNFGGHDIVYVDTGIYSNYTVTVGPRQGGSVASGRFTLRGSTNQAAGGTVFNRNNPSQVGLNVTGGRVNIEHLRFINGMRINISADDVTLSHVHAYNLAAPGIFGSINIGNSQNVAFYHCIIKGNGIGVRTINRPFQFNNGTLWGNSAAFRLESGSANQTTISNTVIVGGAVFHTAMVAGGDYNILWDATMGPTAYPNLNVFQKDQDSWWNSTKLDPLFANPAQTNFFPLSVVGRYDPELGDFAVDGVHSPLIDFGDPASTAWTNEAAPNGSRVNAGAFGGTPWASRSRSTPWLQVLTYNGGGTLNVEENDRVYWTTGNLSPGATVRIELAAFPGDDWQVAATNILAADGSWAWTYDQQGSVTGAVWRIVLEEDPTVDSESVGTFRFRNGPALYYVNNHSTEGNVFTTAPGDDSNPGISASAPKASLKSILDSYALEPGDVVYVDTGVYTLPQNVAGNPIMGSTQSGSTNQFVYILGSHNRQAGGTSFRRAQNPSSGMIGLDLNGAAYVQVRDIQFTRQGVGVRVNNAPGVKLVGVQAYSNTVDGIRISGSPGAQVYRSVSRQNTRDGVQVTSGDASVLHSVLWRNNRAGLRVSGGVANMTNSIIVSSSPTSYGVHAATTNSVQSNYNNILAEGDAVTGWVDALGRNSDTLSAWTAETGQDSMSMAVDPLFANPPFDFHLKTQVLGGRFLPGVGGVNDPVTSPLIAAGDPSADFSEEPAPNGGRVNIGLYGNTAEASQHLSAPRLRVASLVHGGWVRSTFPLHWVAYNMSPSDLVTVEYSPDGGESWLELAAGVPATDEVYEWDTTSEPMTVAGLWRVRLEADPEVSSQTTNFFVIRNGPAAWYVNDGSTDNDVFTSAVGGSTNWVATAQRPLNSLAKVFERYDIEPGDIIYVDSGTYSEGDTVTIRRRDSGTVANPVVVLGSTDCRVDGAFLSFSGGTGMEILDANAVVISNLVITGAQTGVDVQRSENIQLIGLRTLAGSGNGIVVGSSSNVDIRRSVMADNLQFGLLASGGANLRLQQSIVWSNHSGGIRLSSISGASVSNSVLTASGTTNRLYSLSNVSSFRSDHNSLRVENNAEIAIQNNVIRRFLTTWQDATENDLRSLTHDPLFVDPSEYDFRLLSEAGRFDPQTCTFVDDMETSPLIDAGGPNAPFAQETEPNGGRLNIGVHGNTPQASRTPAAPRLTAISFHDGGVIRGTNSLYWVATGAATGHTVRVEFRASNETNWTVLATNVAATAGEYLNWDTTEFGSIPSTWWRVVSEDDSSVVGSNSVPFIINNGAISFFINDGSTDGAVYTTAAGSLAHDGLDPATPLPSLIDLLDRYLLQAGDRVYIDTGRYDHPSTLVFDNLMAGSGTNAIHFIGSTNVVAGGTVINRLRGGPVFQLVGTSGYEFSDIRITNVARGVRLLRSTNIVFRSVEVDFPQNLSPFRDRYGFQVVESGPVIWNRVAIHGLTNRQNSIAIDASQSSELSLLNSILWSNNVGVALRQSSDLVVSNSIIGVYGEGRVGIQSDISSSWVGDYNNIYARNGAYPIQNVIQLSQTPAPITITAPLQFRCIEHWRAQTGLGLNTMSHQPLFADPGSGNFYLRSAIGRFNPDTGQFVTSDIQTSPLIDAGDPAADFALEPDPNGGRINMGLYGGTEQASKSRSGALHILNFNDGGVAQGDSVPLRWRVHGTVTNSTVTVRFSDDAGDTWTDLATGVPATDEVFVWDTTTVDSTLQAKWRVSSGPFSAQSELSFAVRNTNFVFYVNNDSTDGAVYTTEPGDVDNDGLSPATPLPNLADVFSRYNIEPGDTIYIDTGHYDLGGLLTINQVDAGLPGNPIYVIGSTNRLAGGTVFSNGGVRLNSTLGVTMKNITFSGNIGTALHVLRSTNTFFEAIDVVGAGTAFHIENSIDVRMIQSSARNSLTNGLWNQQSLDVVWEQGLLWSNRTSVRGLSGTTVRNTAFGAFGSEQTIYQGGGSPQADYNSFWVQQGAMVARQSVSGQAFPQLYSRLGNWVQTTGQDQHSLVQNPLFNAAPLGDFHLRSQAPDGRYRPDGSRTQDPVTSPLIDAGAPGSPFDQEPSPNGGRVNIGRFGNTFEASLTPTNAALHAVSLYDGGTVRGTNLLFTWVAQGVATGHTVQIEFSPDNGANWEILGASIPASDSSFLWTMDEEMPATVLARWRISSEQQTNLVAEPPRVFAIRNEPVLFYVNNAETNGLVYTTGPGMPGNTGTTPADPMLSIQEVLDTYDTEPGDVIYVDTGTYELSQSLQFTSLDAGSVSNNIPLSVIGSTNQIAGGTVLNAVGVSPVISLANAEAVSLRNLTLQGAGTGISLSGSPGFDFRHLRVKGGTTGISVGSGSDNGRVLNSLIRDATGPALALSGVHNFLFENGVLWSNATSHSSVAAVQVSGGSATFRHAVFSQFGRKAVYSWNEAAALNADYNFYQLGGRAYVSRRSYPIVDNDPDPIPLPIISRNLTEWLEDYEQDVNSLAGDPLFADPIAGNFRPMSVAGRFDPVTGMFTNDLETSLLIDSGDRDAPFANEPEPNGGRINIGKYGNTSQASRSPATARLGIVSLREGGAARGESYPLRWRAYGAATNYSLRLEFSPDDGANWQTILTNVPATVEGVFWDTTQHPSTWSGVWRAVAEQDETVQDTSLQWFAVRNDPLSLYVNDGSTNGNVYTIAVGANENSGISPDNPRASLQSVLDDYDLEPGDTIYMDTGTYLVADTIQWTRFSAWRDMKNLAPLRQGGVSVTLQGSTNDVAGGTRIIKVEPGTALATEDAYGVRIRNIRFTHATAGGGRSIRLVRSPFSVIEWVQSRDASVGIDIQQSHQVRVQHCLLRESSQIGLLSMESSNTVVRNSVMWDNQVGARVVGPGAPETGSLTVENSVLGMLRPGTVGMEREDTPSRRGTLVADYNLYQVEAGAFVGRLTGPYPGGRLPYSRMIRWRDEVGVDANSIVADARFANPDSNNFHPQSPFGRYVSGVGYVTNKAEAFSPLIDGGRLSDEYDQEPDPNGGRINIGLYGNTAKASMSPTNGVLRAVTFNDGGSSFSNIWLHWTASGPVAAGLVSLDYSNDGGMTWTNIVADVPASQEAYEWDSTPFGRVVAGRWRVVSQSDPSVASTNQQFFRLRQDGSVPYYVNHPNSAGDVYTTAPGNNNNDGWLPSTPMASLQAVIDANEIEPGDVIYIDSGVYERNADTVLRISEAGREGAPVIIRGSTNTAAGGTILNRMTGAGNGLLFNETQWMELEHITIRNAGNAIRASDSRNVVMRGLDLTDNQVALSLADSFDVYLNNSLLADNNSAVSLSSDDGSSDIRVNHITAWGNSTIFGVGQGTSVGVSNSLLRVRGSDERIFNLAQGVTGVTADYNNYVREDGAVLAERATQFGANEYYPRLLDWQRFLGQDMHSLAHDPKLFDPGADNFRPKSVTGRWSGSQWVMDSEHSPLIDTGAPDSPFDLEPDPNGERVNIGRYGNTPEASMSRTDPWILAVSVNDGGIVSGTQKLYWVTGNIDPSEPVEIQYASDGADFTTTIASGVPAGQGSVMWDASQLPFSANARWRIRLQSDPTVVNAVDRTFIVKNQILTVYVNNHSTDDNVFTTAPGDSENDGLAPDRPLASPREAVSRYVFGPGDVLYIDTGSYIIDDFDGLRFGLVGDDFSAGVAGFPITILGSTNHAAGGTTLQGVGNNTVLNISEGAHMDIRNLRFRASVTPVQINNSDAISFYYPTIRESANGFVLNNARNVSIDRALVYGVPMWGYQISGAQSSVLIDRSIAWDNGLGAVSVGAQAGVQVRNSILDASRPNSLVYSIHEQSSIGGNYNVVWPGDNPAVAANTSAQIEYRSLRSWQRARNMDQHSVLADPLFADPSDGNFRLLSQGGRYIVAFAHMFPNNFAPDPETSWAIDAGDPSAPFGAETAPNGGRLNIGRYGNTYQASRSVTSIANAAVKAVSLRNGGTIGFSYPLYWLYRGLDVEETVRLEYSTNDGVDWHIIATNVPIWQQTYDWVFSEEESTPLGLWRITVESNPSVTDQTPEVFTMRNAPISYFVNVTNGFSDIYTTAPGHPDNNGITAATPVDSIQAILERYELEDGDTIYVDTGIYEIDSDIRILANVSGTGTNRVIIQGSTNRLAGGSVIHRVRSGPNFNEEVGFDLFGANAIEIRNFTIENADIGIRVNNPTAGAGNHLFRNLLIRDGGSLGMSISGNSPNNRLERVVITRQQGSGLAHGSGVSVDSSIIWSNQLHAVNANGALSISNSVLHAMGTSTNVIYNVGQQGSVNSDFNALHVSGTASYGQRQGFFYTGLPQWSRATGQDWRSIAADPLFANPAEDDYHLRSEAGRYIFEDDIWINDSETSLLIDLGSPLSDWGQEPPPNGGRRNIGLYGGTPEASMSPEDPWVLAVTAIEGGRMGGIIPLYWGYGNLSETNRIRLEYSLDNGDEWALLAGNVPIDSQLYFWNSTEPVELISPIARWRVMLEADSNVVHETSRFFGLNGPFTFYVNDDSTVDNMFTTEPGDDENLGIFPHVPKRTVRRVFEEWDLEPDDRVLVDTGTYLFGTNDVISISIDDEGAPGSPVVIRGSTEGSGTIWDGSPLNGSLIFDSVASQMRIEDIQVVEGTIRGTGTNVVFRNMSFEDGFLQLSGPQGRAESIFMEGGSLQVSGDGASILGTEVRDGSVTISGNNALMRNTVVSRLEGVVLNVSGANVTLQNNTLVGGSVALRQTGSDSSIHLLNSILVAEGSNGQVIQRQAGVIDSDYNLLLARGGGWIGNADRGMWERLTYWQERSGQDTHSISVEPLFADETARDYRLRSSAGRWTPSGYAFDAEDSPAIDAGDPATDFGNEPTPNGSRVNLGAYGNTEQASRSREDTWLLAMSLNDSGAIRDNFVLRWLIGGLDSGTNTVTLQYQPSAGDPWETIVSGLPATQGEYVWDTTGVDDSFAARWRVVLDSDPSVLDESDDSFAVRNVRQDFFVNNGVLTNIYTTTLGSPGNDGLTPATPKTSIQGILAAYDTVGGDTIYVDTGHYDLDSDIRIIWSRGGDAVHGPLTIQGSTNAAAGGTVLRRGNIGSGQGFNVNASHVTLRNMAVHRAQRGLFINTNRHVTVEQMSSYSNRWGVVAADARNLVVRNMQIWNNQDGGMDIVNVRTAVVENITFVGNANYSYRARNPVVNSILQNNIIVVDEPETVALAGNAINAGQMFIDYNIYDMPTNSYIFGTQRDLREWQLSTGHDFRSALTNAALLYLPLVREFVLESEYGTHFAFLNTFINRSTTSWGIGRGNPNSPFDNQTDPTAGRINLGAFGNTRYASRGSTNLFLATRTLNDPVFIDGTNNVQPLVWAANWLPEELLVAVQFSGDGGDSWTTVATNVNVYQEYFVHTLDPEFNTFRGSWRVIGQYDGTVYEDESNSDITVKFGDFDGIRAQRVQSGLHEIEWRGFWDERYRIEYTEDGFNWSPAIDGVGDRQQADFISGRGGDFFFQDVESATNRFRSYRVWRDPDPSP